MYLNTLGNLKKLYIILNPISLNQNISPIYR